MRSQREIDIEMVSSAVRMINDKNTSFLRLVLFTVLSGTLAVYQLNMNSGFLSSMVILLFCISALLATIESAKFGYKYGNVSGAMKFIAAIIISSVVIFYLHRLFDYLEWTPTNRTLGWILFIQVGFMLGFLASKLSVDELANKKN
jgi:uncharacterized membrane protein YeaQ/YmgE (transglycosylase-associated protein family)